MPKGFTKYVDIEYPHIAKQFIHPEESHVASSSSNEVEFACKCCSTVFTDTIRNVVLRGNAVCVYCRDGISYPEKFMCNLLDQLNIDFELHYYDKWTNGYYYDFELKYNNIKYIIEMDGGLGHGHNVFKNANVKDTIIADQEKDLLAINNGYKIIRIDCFYNNNFDGRYKYVKENVIKELSGIFDLSKINFDKCNQYALGSLFYEIVNFYKNNSKYINDISKKFHLKKTSICKYLKHAMKIGLLPTEYLHENDRFKNIPVPVIRAYRDEEVRNTKIIYCYDDAIAFDSVKAVSQYLNVSMQCISDQIRNFNGIILGKKYCYYDDLPNDFNFKPVKREKIRYKPIYQYTKDKKQLIERYENKTYLPPEFLYNSVIKVCNNTRKTYKGFWWSYINIFDELETA